MKVDKRPVADSNVVTRSQLVPGELFKYAEVRFSDAVVFIAARDGQDFNTDLNKCVASVNDLRVTKLYGKLVVTEEQT